MALSAPAHSTITPFVARTVTLVAAVPPLVFPTAPHAHQPPPSSTSLAIPLHLGADAKIAGRIPPDSASRLDKSSHKQHSGHIPAAASASEPVALNLQTLPRTLTPASKSRSPHRTPTSRLWNPTNSTPRANPCGEKSRRHRRPRRPSTPPPPSVPLSHPSLANPAGNTDPVVTGSADHPLLTLPQLRQARHSDLARQSLQADRISTSNHRVSLPKSIRPSFDENEPQSHLGNLSREASHARQVLSGSTVQRPNRSNHNIVMAEAKELGGSGLPDLESGLRDLRPRDSNVSAGDGIGSMISSSNSSIMGEEVDPNEEEWGPGHPCFPHMNPHVPVESPEYTSTRVIRIKRDWMLKGDLAPTFSNLYPEILDPAGLSEQEFRRIIDKVNSEVSPAFDPYNPRNLLDGVLGAATGWLWDDLGLTGTKSRLNNLEKWIENWNLDMEKSMGAEDAGASPRIISLRRTGYTTLDIQIPDPEIAEAPSTSADDASAFSPVMAGA